MRLRWNSVGGYCTRSAFIIQFAFNYAHRIYPPGEVLTCQANFAREPFDEAATQLTDALPSILADTRLPLCVRAVNTFLRRFKQRD